VPRGRELTDLHLLKAYVSGAPGWLNARWRRADGSEGDVFVQCRRKTAKRWYIATLVVSIPTGELLRDVPLARIEQAINANPDIREWIEQPGLPKPRPPKVVSGGLISAERQKLARPTARQLSDDFYRDVALAYRSALAHGLHPAKTLAIDSGAPQGTVNRWIAEARERGELPETTRGKARA
jgi:hypothetical protein